MKRLFLISALLFLIPTLSRGADGPLLNPPSPGLSLGAIVNGVPSPNSCPEAPDNAAMTLEQIKQKFGAHNVCGIPCGRFTGVNCTFDCGDAALCYHGYCIYQ